MIETHSLLDLLPTWSIFPVSVLVLALAAECGFQLNKVTRHEGDQDPAVSSMIGANLALLAFMLGFTFSIAMNRYDQRFNYLVTEANAIGTAFLRADILPEPSRAQVKSTLREYVAVRLKLTENPASLEQELPRSQQLGQTLWGIAAQLGREHPNYPVYGLFISATNDVIDLQANRLAVGLYARVPTPVWITLFAVAIFAIGCTGFYRAMGGRRHNSETTAMILSFAMVLTLVVDLDRPASGFLKTPQQPMYDLSKSINSGQ